MGVLWIESSEQWAERTFGAVQLCDARRTRRVVAVAARMMRRPDASLPQQMGAQKRLKAVYRLLAEHDVTHDALMAPHWQQTRQMAGREPGVVLLVQDTTEADYTRFPATRGLEQIGNGYGQGFLLQTVLAVRPGSARQVLGIAHSEAFFRQAAPAVETPAQRRRRPRESQVWTRAVAAVGPGPAGAVWVHVGDRGSDFFEFFEACEATQTHFLVRAAQNRKVQSGDGQQQVVSYLLEYARQFPAVGAPQTVAVAAQHGQPARRAQVAVSWGQVLLQAPRLRPGKTALAAWVVRAAELGTPQGAEPLEWVLVTSVPTATAEQAWERVAWYRCRWIVEDYHQCLKMGCGLEQRRLEEGARLMRLVGLLGPIAVRLLQLRDLAQQSPQQLAQQELPSDLVRVVAALVGVTAAELTVEQFWREVAQQGGYQGRRGAGPPGWRILWQGWHYLQTLLEGVRLAAQLPP